MRRVPAPVAIHPAPGLLDHVRRFVNTIDIEQGTDDLTTPEALRRWLVDRGLMADNRRVHRGDLERALQVREGLRALLLANNGMPVDQVALIHLDEVADLSRIRLRFLADGSAQLEPLRHGVIGALGTLLVIAHAAMGDGSWWRLKACPEVGCRWAFYDSSKSRTRRWCTMRECGNRVKARRFRARHQPRED